MSHYFEKKWFRGNLKSLTKSIQSYKNDGARIDLLNIFKDRNRLIASLLSYPQAISSLLENNPKLKTALSNALPLTLLPGQDTQEEISVCLSNSVQEYTKLRNMLLKNPNAETLDLNLHQLPYYANLINYGLRHSTNAALREKIVKHLTCDFTAEMTENQTGSERVNKAIINDYINFFGSCPEFSENDTLKSTWLMIDILQSTTTSFTTGLLNADQFASYMCLIGSRITLHRIEQANAALKIPLSVFSLTTKQSENLKSELKAAIDQGLAPISFRSNTPTDSSPGETQPWLLPSM